MEGLADREALDFSSLSFSSIIELNVGGTVYCTNKHTLLDRYPQNDTYFAKILMSEDGDKWDAPERDRKGRLFIDRDGKAFRYILNFLRTGKVFLPADRLDLVLQIAEEAGFYGLSDLEKLMTDHSLRMQSEMIRKKMSTSSSVLESPQRGSKSSKAQSFGIQRLCSPAVNGDNLEGSLFSGIEANPSKYSPQRILFPETDFEINQDF